MTSLGTCCTRCIHAETGNKCTGRPGTRGSHGWRETAGRRRRRCNDTHGVNVLSLDHQEEVVFSLTQTHRVKQRSVCRWASAHQAVHTRTCPHSDDERCSKAAQEQRAHQASKSWCLSPSSKKRCQGALEKS